jgi:MFS family permease
MERSQAFQRLELLLACTECKWSDHAVESEGAERMVAEGRTKPLRKASYYAWVILGVSFLVSMLIAGINTSFGVFLIPLSYQFGWSAGAISFAYSLFMLTNGLSAFGVGRLGDKYGSRLIFFIGGLVFGLSLLLTSRMTEVWHLYLWYGILAGIGRSPLNVTLVAMISRWFSKHRGLAMGIVNSGTGAGSSLFTPFTTWLIVAFSWQEAYIVMAVMVWIFLTAAVLLLRDDPRQMGYLPYGEEETQSEPAKAGKAGSPKKPPKGHEWELGEAMRTKQFWELGILHFACCMCHAIPLVHIVPYAIRSGLSPATAASILSAIGVFSFLGRIMWGVLADRWGPKPAYVLAVFQQGLMMIWLLGTSHPVMFFLFAFFWGIGYGGAMPPYALFVKDYYGLKSFGSIYGGIMVLASLGMAAGGYLGGFLFDLSGSYQPAWMLSLVAGVVTAFVALDLAPPVHPRQKQESTEESMAPVGATMSSSTA